MKQTIYACDVRGCDETTRGQLRAVSPPPGWLELSATMANGKGQPQQGRTIVHCPKHAAELLERVGGWA